MNAPMIDIPYAHYVGPLLSAGQPSAATLTAARDAGYAMVINLRVDGEFTEFDEVSLVESLGMKYRTIAVNGRAGITEGNARALQAALAEAGDRPVLVHCGTGNRVGALVAYAAWLDGADVEAAIAAGKQAGMVGLEPALREMMAR